MTLTKYHNYFPAPQGRMTTRPGQFYPGTITREDMVREMERHGWITATGIDDFGPFMQVDTPGLQITARVPMFNTADHAGSIDAVYSVYGKWLMTWYAVGNA